MMSYSVSYRMSTPGMRKCTEKKLVSESLSPKKVGHRSKVKPQTSEEIGPRFTILFYPITCTLPKYSVGHHGYIVKTGVR